MKKNKQQKKRIKKYKGKYVTADRLDMSKGGRVKAAVGGRQQAPMSRRRPPMSIEREEEPKELKPVQPVRKPIAQKPQKPVQPGIPVTGGGNLKSGKMPRADLPTGTAKPPVQGRRKAVTPVSGNKLKSKIIPNSTKGLGQISIDQDNRAVPTNDDLSRLRTTEASSPVQTAQAFQQAPIESKRPDVIQPQERFIENIDTAANNIDTTFRQAPTTGKGSDQMFIGREGEVKPAMSVKDIEDGRTEDKRNEPKEPPNGEYTKEINGFIHVWNGYTYTNTGQKTTNTTNNTTNEETGETAVTGSQEQFESERAKRMTQTGRTAEDIAAGTIPEGILPEQELVSVKEGEEYDVEIIELAKRKGVSPEYVKEVGPETVQQMENISTIKTPEPVTASKINEKTVAEEVEVNVARGEVRDEALAKAVGVEKIATVEGVEVEVEPGALANKVVGVLSEEAKSTAAQVAGTSLPRITRAKKQLRNAGLSEEDIAELGSDPEALEARLTDFTEEQRGVIEGLPEEALVSNQLDSLLSGMENGEIPAWARPAVSQVEQMLAKRGMSASTVGRDSLFNAIIQSAVPLAQSNAKAIQQSVGQQKSIEAQVEIQNAQLRQQTALKNADKVFSLNMAQFNADQQTELSNSKYMQTVSITNANNKQKAVLQNAVLMSQANIAEASLNQQAQIQNAKTFLAMDMQNLSNEQQSNVLQSQQEQQRILSNQAATNAAKQFNAASQNQTDQFMAGLNTQVEQFNAQQNNAAEQFNVQQNNAAEARRVGIEADINKANAAIVNQTKQFNEQIDFNREQFNTQNSLAIQQSNVEWRRRTNLADTAAENAINQENAKMAFGMTSAAQSFLWQELRDQADYNFRWANDTATRKVQAMIAAAGAEGDVAKNWQSNFNNISRVIDRIIPKD